jgi:hypothetical protein
MTGQEEHVDYYSIITIAIPDGQGGTRFAWADSVLKVWPGNRMLWLVARMRAIVAERQPAEWQVAAAAAPVVFFNAWPAELT